MAGLSPEDQRLLDWLRSDSPDPDPDEITIDIGQPRSRSQRQRRPPRPVARSTNPQRGLRATRQPLPPGEPVRPGSLAAVFAEETRCNPETAHQLARLWTRYCLTEPLIVREWLRADFDRHDASIVAELCRYGLTPELMTTPLRGETMLDRMRLYGYTPDKVAATLQEAGLVKRSA